MEARAAKKRLRRRLLQVRGVTVNGIVDILGAAESEGHMSSSHGCSKRQFRRDLAEVGAAIEGEENRGRAIVVSISSPTCAHMQARSSYPRVRLVPEVRLRKRVSFTSTIPRPRQLVGKSTFVWHVADPVKTLRWLGENCPKWVALVRSCLRDDHALRIILYLDEITPGNPFNLDHRRSAMASNACALYFTARASVSSVTV